MNYFVDDAADFLSSKTLKDIGKKIGATSLDDVLKFLGGKEFALNQQARMMAAGSEATKLGRFAGGKAARNILRVVPGLTAGLAALDAADIVTNDTNILNKGMDTTAMAIGGALGSVGGPLGTMAGASTGKFVSDSLQWLFGDKKTPEQRKLEETLALLGAGR